MSSCTVSQPPSVVPAKARIQKKQAIFKTQSAIYILASKQNETRVPIEIERQAGLFNNKVILIMREAFGDGIFDSDLEQFGAVRVPIA